MLKRAAISRCDNPDLRRFTSSAISTFFIIHRSPKWRTTVGGHGSLVPGQRPPRGGAGQQAYERQQKKDQNEPDFEATVLEVSAAIEKFVEDEATLTAGITAQSEGTGWCARHQSARTRFLEFNTQRADRHYL